SRFLYAPHGTMSLVRRFVLLPGIWGHTDVIVAQCWYQTSVIPTWQPMNLGGSFCHCLACGVYSCHGDQCWNQTSVCPTCRAMRLVGRVVPLASMWGIQMSGSNIDHHDN
ncbi:hypothetical protein GOODEAATRI_032477, partial [Goodea atripinnis]